MSLKVIIKAFTKGTKEPGAHTPQFRAAIAPPPPIFRRPCEVDGKPCIFHRWVDEDKALLGVNLMVNDYQRDKIVRGYKADGVAPHGCEIKVLRHTYALVEYPDGSVGKVEPELVTFLDRRATE